MKIYFQSQSFGKFRKLAMCEWILEMSYRILKLWKLKSWKNMILEDRSENKLNLGQCTYVKYNYNKTSKNSYKNKNQKTSLIYLMIFISSTNVINVEGWAINCQIIFVKTSIKFWTIKILWILEKKFCSLQMVWVIKHSGSTSHMCNDGSLFENVNYIQRNLKLASQSTADVLAKGDVKKQTKKVII